jgi:DeoR/GlpR family transcriptional regulator of sugar metabolism
MIDIFVEEVMRYKQLATISSRHSRLLDLVREGAYSTPSLSKRLGVSEQTIYRDIDYLKQKGYLIKAVRMSRGWAYRIDESDEEAA